MAGWRQAFARGALRLAGRLALLGSAVTSGQFLAVVGDVVGDVGSKTTYAFACLYYVARISRIFVDEVLAAP